MSSTNNGPSFVNAANVQPVVYDPSTGNVFAGGEALGILNQPTNLPLASIPLRNSFVAIGDSRTDQLFYSTVDAAGYRSTPTGRHYFNVANALLGQPWTMVASYGISGLRSDQYLTINLQNVLNTNAEYVLWGPPGVNDITQSVNGYTDAYGRSITISNVADIVAQNIKTAVIAMINSGKKVILSTEWGSTSLTTAGVGQLFRLNEYLRYIAKNYPGVYLWDGTGVLWNQTGSATALAFNTGYSTDGTHMDTLGGYYGGKSFAAFMQNITPVTDFGMSNIADVYSTNSLQILQNPLFQTLTGGNSSGAVITGNVPSGWTIVGSGTTSITVSSATNANGYGNDITLAITASAADSVRFQQGAIPLSSWGVADVMFFGAEVAVAAGSSNASVWAELQINTTLGTPSNFSLYADRTYFGAGPTEAYNYKLQTIPRGVTPGSTTNAGGYVSPRLHFDFKAAGSATITIRRPFLRKQLTV